MQNIKISLLEFYYLHIMIFCCVNCFNSGYIFQVILTKLHHMLLS